MKEFLKNAFWSILFFFGIILAISYYNESYVGMKRAFSDPFNWVIIGVVIVASFAVNLYRRRKESTVHKDTDRL